MRWCLAGSLVVATPACLVGEVQGIPCASDEQCATDAFCDLPARVCIGDGSTPPDVVVGAIVDPAGDVVGNPFVVADAANALAFVVQNRGGAAATALALRTSPLACLALAVDDAALPATLDAGASVEVPFTVTPSGCATPTIQDWFLTFSGRATRGTFNFLIESAPPAPD